jgi:hypothetical protein
MSCCVTNNLLERCKFFREEEEQRLFTQPEAEAEAIDDLMAAITKKLDPLQAKPPTRRRSVVTSLMPTWMPS